MNDMTVIVSENPGSPGRLFTARGRMSVMQQRIDRLRLADGTSVSYAVAGSGPPWCTCPVGFRRGAGVGVARRASLLRVLATGRTLIRYDRPGSGLSDPAAERDLVELEMGARRAFTAWVCRRRPARHLTVGPAGGPLGGPPSRDGRPAGALRRVGPGDRIASAELREHVLGLIEHHWGLGSEVLIDIFAPGADAGVRQSLAVHQRASASARPRTGRWLPATESTWQRTWSR